MSKKSKVLNKKIKVKKAVKKVQKKKPKPAVAKKKPAKPLAKKKSLVKKSSPAPAKKGKNTGAKKKPVKKLASKPAKKTQSKPIAKSKAVVAKKSASKPLPKNTLKSNKVKSVSKAAPSKKTEVVVKEKQSKPVKQKESKVSKTETKTSVFNKPVKNTPEVLAVQNTLPVKTKDEISLSKIVSISSSITNAVKKTDSYSIKPDKEPAGKFELEFVIHSSAEMLYEFLSTPSGLSEWFCDDLNIRNGIYTFIWDDQLMQARLLKTVELQVVRFQWVDKTDGSYFEFRIQKDDLTNDISLIITDFAESSGERESAKLLWQSQIEKLRHVIGSIF